MWNDNNLGNAILTATSRARIDVRPPMVGLPLVEQSKRQLQLGIMIRNSRVAPPSPPGIIRTSAGCEADESIPSPAHARTSLPKTLVPTEVGTLPINVPTSTTAGR